MSLDQRPEFQQARTLLETSLKGRVTTDLLANQKSVLFGLGAAWEGPLVEAAKMRNTVQDNTLSSTAQVLDILVGIWAVKPTNASECTCILAVRDWD